MIFLISDAKKLMLLDKNFSNSTNTHDIFNVIGEYLQKNVGFFNYEIYNILLW